MRVRHQKYGEGTVKESLTDEFGIIGYMVRFDEPPVIYSFIFYLFICLKEEVEIC